jgi:tetratricopeptide (TPR) repeat protein
LIADYNESIRLNPNDSNAFSSRALAYGRKGNDDQAIADSNEAIRLNPNNYLALDIGKLLAIVVAQDKAGVQFFD